MAATRRGYIFGAFVSSVLCVILVIVAIASDSWIVATAYASNGEQESTIRYGMFRGEFGLYLFTTPSYSTLYMVCVPDMNACAVSCKTEATARREEVEALAQGFRPNDGCVSVTTVNTINPFPEPPVLPFGIYVSTLAILFLHMVLAATTALLAIVNAMTNPTEPIFGLPGCLWSNVVTAVLGLIVLLLFGINWATSGLQGHLAFSYIALGNLGLNTSLGYSYWLLIGAIVCSLANIGLILLRRYLLERDPPPPTLKVENHSDGTIFLY